MTGLEWWKMAQEPTELDTLTNEQLSDVLEFVLRDYFRSRDSGSHAPAEANSGIVKLEPQTVARDDPAQVFFISGEGANLMTLNKYINRLLRHPYCPKSTFVLAIVYLARLDKSSVLKLSELNAHRLYATAVLLAMKWVQDEVPGIRDNAFIAIVSPQDLLNMETQMLQSLDFRLHVEQDSYHEMENSILYIAKKEVYKKKQSKE